MFENHPKTKNVVMGICLAAATFATTRPFAFLNWADNGYGRNVNGVSAILAGIMAEKMGLKDNWTFQVEKNFWPDISGAGNASKEKITATIDDGKGNFSIDLLDINLRHSNFSFGVSQSSNTVWEVRESWGKFEDHLRLDFQGNEITGKLVRPFAQDWELKGDYLPQSATITVKPGAFNPEFTITVYKTPLLPQ